MNSKLQQFIDAIKQSEQQSSQGLSASNQTSNHSAETANENKNQKIGEKIMEKFIDRESQFPDRIKLIKIADEADGTVYRCVSAEGTVTTAGTKLDAKTLNKFIDEFVPKTRTINGQSLEKDITIETGKKLYRHRISLKGYSTYDIEPIATIDVYTHTDGEITKAIDLWTALKMNKITNIPASGCTYNGNKTIVITDAEVSTNSIYLKGMYFGYSSNNGEIQRVTISTTGISDSVESVE